MKRFSVFTLAFVVVIVGGIWFFQSTCEIENDSGYALRNIVLSGNRFSKTIVEIPPRYKRKISFFPPHESDLMITFTADNKTFERQVIEYYDGGAVHIKVRNNFTVESDVDVLGR